MKSFSKITWYTIQKARRRRRIITQFKNVLKDSIAYLILALALLGLVSIIFSCFGYRLSNKAEAAENKTEQIIDVEKEIKLEVKKESPKLSDTEIIKTLKDVCRDNGMIDPKNNEVCWQTLWAMSYQESKLGYLMTGDQGRSKGYFHIQTKLHNVTEECATDLNCSANWTLKRLISKGFPVRWSYSVQSHNGFGTEAAQRGEYAKIIEREIASINN